MTLNPKGLVFIVDDNEDYCIVLKKAFAKTYSSCRLEFFRSGQTLLDRLETMNSKLPDLIMLDLIMPEMDGQETLQKVRQNPQLKGIPTVMVSVSDSPEDIDRCYQEGVNAYVIKPFRLEDLNYIVDVICRYWLETAQLPTQGGRY